MNRGQEEKKGCGHMKLSWGRRNRSKPNKHKYKSNGQKKCLSYSPWITSGLVVVVGGGVCCCKREEVDERGGERRVVYIRKSGEGFPSSVESAGAVPSDSHILRTQTALPISDKDRAPTPRGSTSALPARLRKDRRGTRQRRRQSRV